MSARLFPAVLAVSLMMACGSTGPASLEFVEINPAQPRIGDVVTVRFKLLDSRGLPLAGENVKFKIQPDKSGVNLSPAEAASIKGSGFAETQLIATGHVTSVIVVATAGDKQVLSPPISFAGSVPNARQFTFQCGELSGEASGGRHAIGAYDQARNLIAGVKLNCTAHVGDRNGDGVPGALVSFLTEAGTIGPTETSQSNVVGNATILYKTSLPLPLDVAPEKFTWTPPNGANQTGALLAPLWMVPFDWVANPLLLPRPPPGLTPQEPSRTDPILKTPGGAKITNNPRDNLVAMIAVTSGEESYTDVNGNGTFDSGDIFDPSFDDLTEPFVDSNDNGTWDTGEKYIDTNSNGAWDPKNGEWDGSTLIWVQERILWTGIPAQQDADSAQPLVKPIDPSQTNITMTCPSGSFCSQAGPPQSVPVILSDPWYNALAQNSDGDGCVMADPDENPVKLSPKTINGGTKFVYPAGEKIVINIKDARDPLSPPQSQIPPRRPGVEFTAPVFCQFTASPIGGHVVIVGIGSIHGTIE